MIPEPQLTYVLELLGALGPAANEFVIAGAQAMKFTVAGARATKDIDFILDVIGLRDEPLRLADVLKQLGYAPVERARNFQFEKSIPNSTQKMRIEFMAPDEFRRRGDFRVDVQNGVHARACTGAGTALAESDVHNLIGTLPDGKPFMVDARVIKPHALVMLKLLALSDRYNNVRGDRETRHDREEAQTHAGDIVAIVAAQPDLAEFNRQFEAQFQSDPMLGIQVLRILVDFFQGIASPGLVVYTEHLAANLPMGGMQNELRGETERGHRMTSQILPPTELLSIAAAVDDSCDWERTPALAESYLMELENRGISIEAELALQFLPETAFGDGYQRGDSFVVSAAEAVRKISDRQAHLLGAYLRSKAVSLRTNEKLRRRFPNALTHT